MLRTLKHFSTAAVAALLAACATPIQLMYDAEVDRLCALDGGVKAHRVVSLPAAMFDNYGHINFFNPWAGADALGPEFEFHQEQVFLATGSPSLVRGYAAVRIRQTGELLGEAVWFGRGGGDAPGPWHPSNHICPDNALSLNPLFNAIFKLDGSN